ncbi:ABC transporter permease [Schumannella luteola]|uniref:ABC-type methionine transport system permease subunit n=1 Tax=Schumannella luteola TaxID=472059 RepID=A0A852YEI9_9MICO|nr:methionine ABC transporter permease [Schumannella luteola]NYG97528.1 ABC-type methionine transport system permease subunit [Schumannella luteola]TPX01548.1 ABC transporter permease [Schumannella luteola]
MSAASPVLAALAGLQGPVRGSNLVPLPDIPALVLPALGDTLIMVGVTMAIVVVVGVPLGAVVHNLGPDGLFPHRVGHQVLSWVISVGRSLPFLVLMASIIPFTRLLTGTNIGIPAAVVPMSIAGIAFFTRIVENSLRGVPRDYAKVAIASGASTGQAIVTAQLAEAVPSIIGGLTINTIAMIEYSAIAGTIGAGGIGHVAVTYGYQRFDHAVMIATIVILVATVAATQLLGDRVTRALTPASRDRRRSARAERVAVAA